MKLENNRINFIPEFVTKQKERRKRMLITAFLTLAVTLACFSVYFIPWLQLFRLETKLENKRTEMSYLKSSVDKEQSVYSFYREFKNIKQELKSKNQLLKALNKEKINVSLLLEKLSSVVPKEAEFCSLFIEDKNARRIGGSNNTSNIVVNARYTVKNPTQILQLVKNLNSLNIFKKVDMPNVPIVDRKTDINFKLKLKDGFVKKDKQ